jgi:hypothetical protein
MPLLLRMSLAVLLVATGVAGPFAQTDGSNVIIVTGGGAPADGKMNVVAKRF